jgi:hypothetical protein
MLQSLAHNGVPMQIGSLEFDSYIQNMQRFRWGEAAESQLATVGPGQTRTFVANPYEFNILNYGLYQYLSRRSCTVAGAVRS